MEQMDGWRIGILVVVGYVAITSLVRMMIGRRNEMMDKFRREMRIEQSKRASSGPEETLVEQTSEFEQDEAA